MNIVEIGATNGHYAGQLAARGYTVELPSLARASRVWIDGQSARVDYDPALGIDRVAVSARSIGRPVVVKVEAALLPQSTLENQAGLRQAAGVLGSTWGHNSLRDIVADSRVSSLDTEHVSALLAVDGVGLVDHNDGVYRYRGNDRLELFAPAGIVDKAASRLHAIDRTDAGTAVVYDTVTRGAESTVAGSPIPAGSLEMDGRHQVGSATVRIAGHTFTLMSNPLASPDNVALTANVSSSSSQPGYSPNGAVDGVVSGYPQDESAEWASNGEKEGAWIKLSWDTPQTIDRIVLYDRPNDDDQVLSGKLTFDDGTSVDVGALPNDASTGAEIKFAPKTVKSVTFTVTSAKSSTQNAGLSEIAVYRQ
jgi:hypothetical protein